MINYDILKYSSKYYNNKGYEIIETPWLIDKDAYFFTSSNHKHYYIDFLNKYLNASAEQGFLQMIDDENIIPGKYQSLTPCFRDEIEDELHKTYFMKNELIEIFPNDFINESKLEKLNNMIDVCYYFFKEYFDEVILIETKEEKSIISFDLQTIKNIELGSYGIRKYKNTLYAYGTGCAEPRLSTALSLEL